MSSPKGQSTTGKRLNAIQLDQSSYGNCIPLVYGKTRVPAQLYWYGSFKQIPHTEKQSGGKGGGGSSSTNFTYTAALILGIGEGPITSVGIVYADKEQTTLEKLGFVFFSGIGGQATWSYLTTNFAAQAIPYDHDAYLAATALDLGDSAAVPNLNFEVVGLKPYGGGILESEPSDVLIDYCTEPNHGVGFNFLGAIQGIGATTYQTYCIAMDFFFSPYESTQRHATDFITELLQTTNSEAVWSGGALRIVPYGDSPVTGNGRTYTPDLTPIYAFFDDDYIYEQDSDPVRVSITDANEIYNVVRVEFLDRNQQYNTAIAEAKDDDDIRINGERAMQTVTLHSITRDTMARQVAQIILQRQLYIRSTFEWSARADFCLLEPMDLVALNDVSAGIVNQLVRLVSIEDSAEDILTFRAEEMMVGPASAPLYDTAAAAGYAANAGVSPGSVATPVLFSAPPLLVDVNGGYEMWMAVAPSLGFAGAWGGCQVYASLDNLSYSLQGTIMGSARMGALTALLPAVADPDDTSTLRLALNNPATTTLDLVSGSQADEDNLRTLLYVDGEFLSFRTAALTGPGAYDLTHMRRGRYGSTFAAHANTSAWCYIDEKIFRLPYDPGLIGKTLYLKFPSFNIYGRALEDLGAVAAYSIPLAAANAGSLLPGNATLVARGNCAVVGDRVFKSGGANAYDSDCYSIEAYSAGCVLKFRAGALGIRVLMGLNSDPLADQNYTSLDHAFDLAPDNIIRIYESGVQVYVGPSYTTSTVLSLTYDGTSVRYYIDGVVKFQSADPGKVFFLDSSFSQPGDAVVDVFFGMLNSGTSPRLTTRGQCVTIGNSIQKVGGIGSWDSDCYSLESFSDGVALSFKPAQTGAPFMIGLNSDPLTDSSYTSLDYAFYCVGDGGGAARLFFYESNVAIDSGTTYAANDVLAIRYDGKWVRYYKNGALLRSVPDPGRTFFFDSSFAGPGAIALDVNFGPLTGATPSPYLARGQCVISDNNVMKSGGVNNWDSDFTSIVGYPVCHVSFKCNTTDANIMVGLNSDPTADQSYTSIDYAWYPSPSGVLQIYESGVQVMAVATGYTISSVLAITYDGVSIRYLLDNVVIRTVSNPGRTFFLDSSFYSPGGGINSVRFGPTTNLAVQSTVQIAPGAATDVFTSGSASVDVFSSSNTPTIVATVTIPPYPYDVDVILTAIGYVDLHAPSAQFPCYADIFPVTQPTTSIGSQDITIARNASTSIPDARSSFSREKRAVILGPGLSPISYYFAAQAGLGSAISGASCLLTNVVFKAEVIKR